MLLISKPPIKIRIMKVVMSGRRHYNTTTRLIFGSEGRETPQYMTIFDISCSY